MSNETTLRSKDPRPSLRALLRRMGNNPGGIGPGEVTGWAASQVKECCYRLVGLGELYPAKLGAKNTRYFSTAEGAAEYLRNNKPVTGACVTQSGRTMSHHTPKHQRAWWPADAPAVETEKTIYTYGRTPPQPLRTNTYSEWGG